MPSYIGMIFLSFIVSCEVFVVMITKSPYAVASAVFVSLIWLMNLKRY